MLLQVTAHTNTPSCTAPWLIAKAEMDGETEWAVRAEAQRLTDLGDFSDGDITDNSKVHASSALWWCGHWLRIKLWGQKEKSTSKDFSTQLRRGMTTHREAGNSSEDQLGVVYWKKAGYFTCVLYSVCWYYMVCQIHHLLHPFLPLH